MQVVF